ncbi:Protein OPY2 [Sugiyamaella lignohabitans]|uniref:Protein OPY2 n=1 Tax=Sugiyamaella lignohabitans TaxID=796027 RepID=A0A167FJW0_9ASCO|nr:Protein OPY2 [Sugiyamaella lignohabitans]ANB15394.1 Protein OPY2 [Sugiyamaella lignohabitans]
MVSFKGHSPGGCIFAGEAGDIVLSILNFWSANMGRQRAEPDRTNNKLDNEVMSGISLTLGPRACVSCPSNPPQCNCAPDENCIITLQSCEQCPQVVCSPNTTGGAAGPSSTSSAGGGGSHAGPIAGGVVGGLAAFALILGFLLWKFVYSASARQKRQEELMMLSQEYMEPNVTPNVDAESGFFEKQRMSRDTGLGSYDTEGKSTRFSSVTMSSINTGRGSNIIPIAYIPGVTSRQQLQDQQMTDQFFSASDILRESQISNEDDIRSSIATTNYRGSAYVPSDVVTAVPMKPNLVELSGANKRTLGPTKNPGLMLNTQEALGDRDSVHSTTSVASSTVLHSAQQIMRGGARSIRIGKAQPVGLQSQFIAEEDENEKDQSSGRLSAASSRISKTASHISAVIQRTASKSSSLGVSKSGGDLSRNPTNSSSSSQGLARSITSPTGFSTAPIDQLNTGIAKEVGTTLGNTSAILATVSSTSGTSSNMPSAPLSNPYTTEYGNGSNTSLDIRLSTTSAFDIDLPFLKNDPESALNGDSQSNSELAVSRAVSRSSRFSHKTGRESVEYVADDLPQEAYLYASSPHLLGAGDNELSDDDELRRAPVQQQQQKPSVQPHHQHPSNGSTLSYASSLSERAPEFTTLIRPKRSDSPEGRSSPFDDKYEHK